MGRPWPTRRSMTETTSAPGGCTHSSAAAAGGWRRPSASSRAERRPRRLSACRMDQVGSCDMLVRYRYRIDPTPGQRQALARVFGCARVVYNDALAERQRAYQAGEGISDTEIQRRVITQAKRTPERAWLTEVASVALVQACQDARCAYRNWFDSLTGKRKGRRVGRPRFRTKHGRQSIRLTRNGFALRGTRLSVAKVGDLRVRWSRELPSVPSSVTVIGEPDGRYYASFVVGRDPTPLPPVLHRRDRSWPALVRHDRRQRRHHRDPRQPAAPARR